MQYEGNLAASGAIHRRLMSLAEGYAQDLRQLLLGFRKAIRRKIRKLQGDAGKREQGYDEA